MRRSATSIFAIIITVCGILAAIGISSCADKQQQASCRSVNPLADSLLRRGQELYEKDEYMESLTILKKAHEIFTEEKDSIHISLTDRTISECYWRMGELENSIVTILEALRIDSLMGNEEHLSSDYHDLAIFYINKKNVDNYYKRLAKEYIDKAVALERKLNRHEKLTIRYGIACEIYTHLGLLDEALAFGHLGYEEAKLIHDTASMYTRNSQIAMVLMESNHFEEAEARLKESIRYWERKGTYGSLNVIDYIDLGNLYEESGRDDDAIMAYNQAKVLAQQLKMYAKVNGVSNRLSRLYHKKKRYEKAIQEINDARAARNNIKKGEDKIIASLYENKVEQENQESVISEQKNKITVRNTLLTIVVVLVGLMMIALAVLYHKKRWPFSVREREVKEIVVVEKAIQEPPTEENKETFKHQLDKVIISHLDDPNLSSVLLAEKLSMSQRHLNRKLKETTGKDTANYIREMRIEEAKRLLEHTHDSISEIYMKCGFDNPSYFSRVFKQIVGVSPTEYRKLKP